MTSKAITELSEMAAEIETIVMAAEIETIVVSVGKAHLQGAHP